MQVTVDLNTIVAMAVVDTVVQMGFPSIYIKLSEDPHEFLKQLRVYTDEYSNDFSEILKQKIKIRASECIYTDLRKQGVSLVFKNDKYEVFFKIPEHLKLQQF
ncbi:hypothetical protein [Enterococcus innesii]|uniref:hypothetical protein n=1 Tax=Enterococcus innesii TaxID=2839759 RepID=UPI0022B9B38A|nr:hypothetical protein [Enterococcus innesii]